MTGNGNESRVRSPRAWRVHAWHDPELTAQMVDEGFISVGGDEIGDLSGGFNPASVHSKLTATMSDRSSRAIAIFVGYWRRFIDEMVDGDVVALPIGGGRLAVGLVAGPYRYAHLAGTHARHRREVRWLGAVDVSELDVDLAAVARGRHTIQEFRSEAASARLLRGLAGQ